MPRGGLRSIPGFRNSRTEKGEKTTQAVVALFVSFYVLYISCTLGTHSLCQYLFVKSKVATKPRLTRFVASLKVYMHIHLTLEFLSDPILCVSTLFLHFTAYVVLTLVYTLKI